jgi:hypothetical protein
MKKIVKKVKRVKKSNYFRDLAKICKKEHMPFGWNLASYDG